MQTLTHLDHILSLSTGGANEISRNAFYILYIAYKHIPASKQIKRVFHNLKIGCVSKNHAVLLAGNTINEDQHPPVDKSD